MTVPDYLDERHAYDIQFNFIQELRKQASCYGKWIDIKEKNGQIAATLFTDEEIISHYDSLIDWETLNSYANKQNIKLTSPKEKQPSPTCGNSSPNTLELYFLNKQQNTR